ncbi:MAG: hypothetical protein DRJ60_00380 [Thermoprotei archaeon]|nr:MAG: hypothetical protein DRJ60_00380 [Thermoprotei archaeon]
MSWEAKILNLLGDIQDPSLRIRIAMTLNYLRDALQAGVSPEEIRNDVFDVVYTVIDFKEPFLNPNEKRKKAQEITEDIMREMKLNIMHKMVMSKLRFTRY